MEACGIDVFATVRANGLEIHTLRDKNEEKISLALFLWNSLPIHIQIEFFIML